MKIHNIFPRPSNRISCYHFANLRASFGAFHTSSTTTKNRQLLRHRATVLSLSTFRFSSSRSLYGKHLPVVAVPLATDSIKSSDLVVLRPNQSVLKRNISIATTLLIFVPVNSEFQCLFRNNLHQTSTKMVWPTEHDRKETQEVPTYIEKYIHCVVFCSKKIQDNRFFGPTPRNGVRYYWACGQHDGVSNNCYCTDYIVSGLGAPNARLLRNTIVMFWSQTLN